MKNVMYYYNDVQSDEELHEDEVVEKLAQGEVMERAGEYWRIVEVKNVTVVGGFKFPVTGLEDDTVISRKIVDLD